MAQLPIFPIQQILLPGSVMPINVFEPHVLRMVQDCVGREMVGIIQPATEGDDTSILHGVGCGARIVEYKELTSTRVMVLFKGIRRFNYISDQIVEAGYRVAEVRWMIEQRLFDPKKKLIDAKPTFIEEIAQFLERKGLGGDLEEFANAPDQHLIDGLAMLLPASNAKKQQMLEASSLHERLGILRTLINEVEPEAPLEPFPAKSPPSQSIH